jgi:kynurenine formamidase
MKTKTYAELLARTDAPAGSSWGLFGPDNDLGTINFLTPERVLAAARLVRKGAVFPVDAPLTSFKEPPGGFRGTLRHTITGDAPSSDYRDDKLDNFYPQGTSQLDGLRHFRHWQHGFYNGVPNEQIRVGADRLGVNKWAEHGIVGRGVLLDLGRHFDALGNPIDHTQPQRFSPRDLEAAASRQGVSFEPGDILMLRTGYARFLFAASLEQQSKMTSPGLEQTEAMVAWLWDHQFSVIATDLLAVEAVPVDPASPFVSQAEAAGERTPFTGFMHRVLLPMLGFALGELWDLERLAEDCAQDGVYECMVVSAPLNLLGGVGSPANAVAIK